LLSTSPAADLAMSGTGPESRSHVPATNSDMSPMKVSSILKFGPFSVTNQVFHVSPSQMSFALVNLKPLLPGHVLVSPRRVTPRLSQLSSEETADLFLTVQRVSKMIERVFKASALNVAVQDGVDAGQSVPHVHVHIIPRQKDDLADKGGGDKIYDMMDGEEGDLGRQFVEMQRDRQARTRPRDFVAGPDSDRKPRSEEQMKEEADWLRNEMAKEDLAS
jgi:bis(5'-adenosyl)-triphosphatase